MPKVNHKSCQLFWTKPRRWLFGLTIEIMSWVIFGSFIVIILTRYMGFVSSAIPGGW